MGHPLRLVLGLGLQSCIYDQQHSRQAKKGRGPYRLSEVDGNPGHADKGLVQVLDSPRGIIMRLVTNKADAAVGDELDIGDLTALGRKVFAKLSLRDGWGKVLDEDP